MRSLPTRPRSPRSRAASPDTAEAAYSLVGASFARILSYNMYVVIGRGRPGGRQGEVRYRRANSTAPSRLTTVTVTPNPGEPALLEPVVVAVADCADVVAALVVCVVFASA